MLIQMVLPFKAVGKGRPRWTGTRMVTPETTKVFEQQVAYRYKVHGHMFSGPVSIKIDCGFAPPKAASKKARDAMIGQVYTHKPDADNITKAILDALNGVAYADDRMVWSVSCVKRYALEDSIMLTIEGVDE